MKNLFDTSLQKNARTYGLYDKIAQTAESKKCVFCDLRDKYIICRHNKLVLTVNIFPYINGHLLIIPERHVEHFTELDSIELSAYKFLADKAMKLLEKKLNIVDFWLLLREGPKAGKTVKHLHWQVMPYFEGIVKWNYQDITLLPEDLAKQLRKND